MTKKETCGADASAKLNRDEFGVDYGKAYGFKQDVELQIQVEAIKAD
jgi:polyisoprenoid-binding protein YceI